MSKITLGNRCMVMFLIVFVLCGLSGCKKQVDTNKEAAGNVATITDGSTPTDESPTTEGSATDDGSKDSMIVETDYTELQKALYLSKETGIYQKIKEIILVEPLMTSSPDGKTVVKLWKDDKNSFYYSVSFEDVIVVEPSALGLMLKGKEFVTELEIDLSQSTTGEVNETYKTITLSVDTAVDHYNERSIRFVKDDNSYFDFIIRAYDDGFAYRYSNVTVKGVDNHVVIKEQSEFILPEGMITYAAGLNATYEGEYIKRNYNEFLSATGKYTTPLLATVKDKMVLFSEASVFTNNGDYCKSSLQTQSGKSALYWRFGLARDPLKEAKGDLDSPGHKDITQVETRNGFSTPWRCGILANNYNSLVKSTLISNLNPAPDATLFADTSWIKPGKVAWSWWAEGNTQGIYNKHVEYIDFAAENGWEYVCLDAGWPNFESRLKELCDYGKSKNVGIFVWINYRDMIDITVMDQIFKKWSDAGIAGLKTDYFESDEQKVIDIIEEVARCAASYKLMVLYHGIFSPCGEYRTYPNIMTTEAVLGEEFRKWSTAPTNRNCLMYPFTRNVVGSMDYTPVGYKIPKVNDTYGFSLAKSVIYESSLQHFAHAAAIYKNYNGLIFLNHVPTSWENTIVLEAEPGEYATFARKGQGEWFIGSMTIAARTMDISLDFLEDGNYNAYIYYDNQDGSELLLEERVVTRNDQLIWQLIDTGGLAVMITKDTINTTIEKSEDIKNEAGFKYYEAEQIENTLTGNAVYTNSVLCSGAYKAGYIGGGEEHTLIINDIVVDSDGEYELLLYYLSGESRKFVLTVNDTDKYETTNLNSGSFDQVAVEKIIIKLKKGSNKLVFSNPNAFAPDLDRIAVSEKNSKK